MRPDCATGAGAVEVLTLNRPGAAQRAQQGAAHRARRHVRRARDRRRGARDRAHRRRRPRVLRGHGPHGLRGAVGGGNAVAGRPTPTTTPFPTRHQIIPWDYPKPIVAALNGATVGGGFELMMCCDLVVAAEHVVFGLAEVKRGLMPGGGGTLLATRIPLAAGARDHAHRRDVRRARARSRSG